MKLCSINEHYVRKYNFSVKWLEIEMLMLNF